LPSKILPVGAYSRVADESHFLLPFSSRLMQDKS
jgi:hypothetical protein